MHTISMRISGDDMIASHEDNYADLSIAAIESISAYERKTGQGFEQAFGTKLFGQYTKTVLWNRKNKKGVRLSSRMEFRNRHISLSPPDGDDRRYEIEDLSSIPDCSMTLEEMFGKEDKHVNKIVDAIVSDPSVVTDEGKLKGYSLVKPTGLSIHFIRVAVDKIKQTLELDYGFAASK